MSRIETYSYADDDNNVLGYGITRDGVIIVTGIHRQQDAIAMAAGLAGENDVVVGTGNVMADLGLEADPRAAALREIAHIGQEQELLDLIHRLHERARIRRQIPTRKSVAEGKPDRIADLLDEAAAMLDAFRKDYFA